MNDSQLADKARGVARTLTYNDDTPQAEAKHLLLEMAHRLDTNNVRVKNGCVTTALGGSRPMTTKERFLFGVFGVVPKYRPGKS